jgi:hypothetical protein
MTVQKLIGNPYLLPTGTSIFAKVLAKNVMGSSEYSTPGNGAILKLSVVPDAPINLARNDEFTLSG